MNRQLAKKSLYMTTLHKQVKLCLFFFYHVLIVANTHTIKFNILTILKCIIQWHLIHVHVSSAITAI